MGDQENTGQAGSNLLVDAAKAVGTAAGKIASSLGLGGAETPAPPANLYRAEYVGSGTFIISKPKRTKHKMRQSQLKNPQRGSRK